MFTWKEEFSVGVEEIDEQHKTFFQIADEIIALVEKGAEKDVLMALLGRLNDYAFYHLGTEEDYFDKFDYPDVAPHVAAHNEYRKLMRAYFEKIRKNELDLDQAAKEIALFSTEWLSKHIIGMDKQYTAFFNEHGLR
jgi:hemerythrin-like metal-binding protein